MTPATMEDTDTYTQSQILLRRSLSQQRATSSIGLGAAHAAAAAHQRPKCHVAKVTKCQQQVLRKRSRDYFGELVTVQVCCEDSLRVCRACTSGDCDTWPITVAVVCYVQAQASLLHC
jgi:hypothetical protein